MWFYSLIFFFLLLTLSLGYFYKVQKITYRCCVAILIIIAGLRPSYCCRDYEVYVEYYKSLSSIPFTILEPTYFLIAEISKVILNGYLGVFILYSILGVGLKAFAFTKLTKYYSISLILYFCSFYLLHEMTQIRVGVASAILLLSIPSIVDRKLLTFLFFLVVGTLFHYSFIIFILFYFLDTKSIKPTVYVIVIAFAFIAFNIGLNLVSFFQLINLGFISDKINTYKILSEQGQFDEIKLINPLLFLRIVIMIVLLYNWRALHKKNKYSIILTKIYSFSVFIFIALADLPVIAGRISQLLGIVEVVVVPFIIYLLSPKYVAVFLSITFAMLILYKQLYYSKLLFGYF